MKEDKKKQKAKLKFSINIPYEFYMGICITLMILVSLAVFINRVKLENSDFRDYYKIYYYIFMANLANITYFTFYYHRKKDKLKGEIGEKGDTGIKGDRGKYITCSFCEYNLYFLKTKNYTKILTLDVGVDEQKIDEELENFSYKMSYNLEYLDLSFLKKMNKSLSMNKNKIIKILKNLFNFTNRMKYLSYHINKAINQNNYSKKISFFKPIGGNGYFPIGHSVFNSELANKMNAFLINGDIRFPADYKIRFTFQNVDELEKQGIEKSKKIEMNYSFIDPIAPIDETREGDEREFVAMGELIVRNQDIQKIANDRNLMACIRKSCAEEIPFDMLQLMAIKISYNTTNKKINRILNYNLGDKAYDINPENLDIYSIWKTPMNTYISNCVTGNKSLQNATVGYNIIDGRISFLKDSGFTLNSKGKEVITKRLKKITLPKILRITFIIMNEYQLFFDQIIYILSNYVVEFTKMRNELEGSMNLVKTNKQISRDELKIADLNEKIEKFELLLSRLNKKNIYNNFDDIFDKDTQIMLEETIPDMEKMREGLEKIPLYVNNYTTLYDLLMYVYPEGYDTIIGVDDNGIKAGGLELNKIQKEILKITKVCFPPNKAVYIPKDECMSYNRIDLDRRTLFREINDVLTKYENLEAKYIKNGTCDENSIEIIQQSFIEIDKILKSQFSHIKNYEKKIKERDMNMFSNSRIKIVIKQYRKKIDIIEKNCYEISDT